MKDHIIGRKFKIYVNTRKKTTKHFQAVGLIRDGIGSFRADLVCHVEMVPIPIAWPLTPIDLLPQLLLKIFEYLGIVISQTVRLGAFISNDSCFRRYQGDGPYGHFQVTVLILAVSSHQIYQFRYLKWTPKAPAY